MTASVRDDLLAAGLAVFDRVGFEAATVAAIRARARASNGSFFHAFGSKKELAGALFLTRSGELPARASSPTRVSDPRSCSTCTIASAAAWRSAGDAIIVSSGTS